jgi:hypothetical protein
MQPSDGRALSVHEGLHTQAYAIDATAKQRFQYLVRERAGRTLDRDLGIGRNCEFGSDRIENAQKLRALEKGRCTASQINRVNVFVEFASKI